MLKWIYFCEETEAQRTRNRQRNLLMEVRVRVKLFQLDDLDIKLEVLTD